MDHNFRKICRVRPDVSNNYTTDYLNSCVCVKKIDYRITEIWVNSKTWIYPARILIFQFSSELPTIFFLNSEFFFQDIEDLRKEFYFKSWVWQNFPKGQLKKRGIVNNFLKNFCLSFGNLFKLRLFYKLQQDFFKTWNIFHTFENLIAFCQVRKIFLEFLDLFWSF